MTEWQPEYKTEGRIEMPVKNKKLWTTIGISLETKLKLDKLKGDESYEKFINKIIDTDKKVDLIVELTNKADKLNNRLERVEKIVKQRSGEY